MFFDKTEIKEEVYRKNVLGETYKKYGLERKRVEAK